jgi:hypothetical protein
VMGDSPAKRLTLITRVAGARWAKGAKRILPIVSQLGEVAEIEAQMFSFVQKFNRRTAVEFSTKPAILPNCCCAIALFVSTRYFKYISSRT